MPSSCPVPRPTGPTDLPAPRVQAASPSRSPSPQSPQPPPEPVIVDPTRHPPGHTGHPRAGSATAPPTTDAPSSRPRRHADRGTPTPGGRAPVNADPPGPDTRRRHRCGPIEPPRTEVTPGTRGPVHLSPCVLRAPGGRAGHSDTHPADGAIGYRGGGLADSVAAWCADSGPARPRPGPRPALRRVMADARRGLANHHNRCAMGRCLDRAHRNRFPGPRKPGAQGAGPAKPADHPTSSPTQPGHDPAARPIASRSSARHQGAEQRKRGRRVATATETAQTLPGGSPGVDRVTATPAGQGRTGGEGSSSRPAFASSSTRHPRGACRDKAMRRRSASTTDDRLLTPRPLDPTHSSRFVTDDSNFRTSPRSTRRRPTHSGRHGRRAAGAELPGACRLRDADPDPSVERVGPGCVARRYAGRGDRTERDPELQDRWRRHRAAPAMGHRAARGQQRVQRRH